MNSKNLDPPISAKIFIKNNGKHKGETISGYCLPNDRKKHPLCAENRIETP
ncbi:MAG: hypothetical protein RIR11_1454 [Bacteroidota bacterium]|jgi:hypothetical protein